MLGRGTEGRAGPADSSPPEGLSKPDQQDNLIFDGVPVVREGKLNEGGTPGKVIKS